MESVYFINLIFIIVLNVFFFFSGICLNSVVIISFWRSMQLRRKLCHFMIMVLSCCDLLAVLTNSLPMAVVALLWLTGKLDVNARWPHLILRLAVTFQLFPLLALLVMNFDRYLATSYPIKHRISVTKKRLLTLQAALVIIEVTLVAISTNDAVISSQMHVLILFVLVTPPMLFINYKLFRVIRKSRRNTARSKMFSLKNVSSCLLAVVRFMALTIPVFVYAGLMINSAQTTVTLDSSSLTGIWAMMIASMNSSFNCLIFYWKNKTLRIKGWKVLKSIKN